MATYHVIHKETKETQIIECSVHNIMDWYADNPGWSRDWSYGVAAVTSEVGEWKDKLRKSKPGWNDVLGKAVKATGGKNRSVTKL